MAVVPQIVIELGQTFEMLTNLSKKAEDISPVLAGPINASIDDLFREQFDSEGALGGQKWAALSPATLFFRSQRGRGRGGILRDSNRLWASLTKFGTGPDAIKVITAKSISRGTRVPYARFHQTGFVSRTFVVADKVGQPVPLFRKTPKTIPARPIVPDPIPATFVHKWEKLITEFLSAA